MAVEVGGSSVYCTYLLQNHTLYVAETLGHYNRMYQVSNSIDKFADNVLTCELLLIVTLKFEKHISVVIYKAYTRSELGVLVFTAVCR